MSKSDSAMPEAVGPSARSTRQDHFLHPSRSSLLLFIVAAFLIAPKIDVIAVLRVEDFVFLLALPVLAWRYAPHRTVLPKILRWYLAYLTLAFFSALINYGNVGLFGVVNVVRQLQYLIWFFVGAQMAAAISEDRFRRAMSIVAAVLILWWLGEASGIIPKIGKFTGATNRVTLNTSGPYEISVVVIFLMMIVRNKILLLGLIGILLASQSRISLAAGLVALCLFQPRRMMLIGVPVIILGAIFLISNPEMISRWRLAETMSPFDMWHAFTAHVQSAPQIINLPEYRHYAYDTLWERVGQGPDISFEIRLIRWGLIIKSLGGDLQHFLVGWGPGAWGAAVDSHVIRYLGEVGVIGFFFVAVFVVTSALSPEMPVEYRASMVVIILCSLFIDVMTSSKIMSFLWAMLGYYYVRRLPASAAAKDSSSQDLGLIAAQRV